MMAGHFPLDLMTKVISDPFESKFHRVMRMEVTPEWFENTSEKMETVM